MKHPPNRAAILPLLLGVFAWTSLMTPGRAAGQSLDCPRSVAEWGGYYDLQVAGELASAVGVAAGDYFSLGLKTNGTVVAWGSDYYGESSVPTNLADVVAIAARSHHALALKSNGTVVEWGFTVGTVPPNLTGVTAVAAGTYHSLALKNDGTVIGWGAYDQGQVAVPTSLTGVVAIAAGMYHSLALKSDGTVVGWGTDLGGQVVPPPNLSNVIAIAAGSVRSLALKNDGTVVEWGQPYYYGTQLPTNLTGVVAIAAGDNFSLALKNDGTVVRWGWGWLAPNLAGVVAIAASGSHAVILSSTPAPPLALDAKLLATNRIALSWLDQSASTASFLIERATNYGTYDAENWSQIGAVPAGVTNFTDLTVGAGAKYWYRVRAHNACHDSAPSPWFAVTVAAPETPPYLYAEKFANQVRLSWNVASAGATAYKVERAPDEWGDPGMFSEIATVTGAGSSGDFTDSGREANATYWYRVRALNGLGASPDSEPVSVTIVPPVAPSWPRAAVGDTNQIVLSWDMGYPNDQEGFSVERALSFPGGRQGPWTEIATIISSNTYSATYTNTGVAKGGSYLYRVSAFNIVGESPPSGSVTISVLPPDAPELYAHAFAHQINLNWSVWSGGEVIGHQLERAPDVGGTPGMWIPIVTITNGISSYTDLGLPLNAKFWYRVRSYNWVGESDFSYPVSATVAVPGTPYQLTAVVGTTNRVNLAWIAASPADQDGFRIERAPDAGGVAGTWTQFATLSLSNSYYAYFTNADVTANTTNWYRVRAFNALGDSAYSEPAAVQLVPPPAPTYFVATPFANRINLTWGGNYAGEIGGYKIERAPDLNGSPGAWTSIATVTGNSSWNYADGGRAAGATYWYRIRAFNWIGESLPSVAVSATITPPAAPVDVSPYVGRSNSVEVGWYNYPADQDGFKIESALDASGIPGAWTEIAVVYATNAYWARYSDTNVTANTTNWYRVRAFNSVGISPYSEPTSVKIVPPPTPYAPSAHPFANSIKLDWSEPYSLDLDGFRIERAPDAGGTPGDWSALATNSGYDSYYMDAGLSVGEKYWYRVRALSWVGESAPSPLVTSVVVAPSQPEYLFAELGATNRVKLHWNAGDRVDQDGFKIERAPDAGGLPGAWTEIATVLATNSYSALHTDVGVTKNTTNWYRVRAFNLVGTSPYSQPASVGVVPPDAPWYLNAAPFRDQVTLNWSAGGGRTDGFKLERALDVHGTPGIWTQIAKVGANTTSFADTARMAGSTSWYRVRAFNWVGDSPFTDPVSATIVPPAPPNTLVARVGDTNSVELSWYAGNPNDEDGFVVERAAALDGAPGPWTETATLIAFHADYVTFTDTNVTADTTNFYRVRAFNSIGFSDFSVPALVEIVKPPAPTVYQPHVYANWVRLAWHTAYPGRIGGYKIERAADTSGVPGNWTLLVTTTNDSSGYYDRGLTASTTYRYRVRAYNWIGESEASDPINATILPPEAPYSLRGAIGLTNQVRIAWKTSPNPFYPSDGGGFAIERAPDNEGTAGEWMEISQTFETNSFPGFPFGLQRYVDTNAMANTTNWYRVRGFNVVGFSDYSEPTSVRVVPPTAPLLSASTFANRAILSWNWVSYPIFGVWSEISGLKIERAADVGGMPGTWSVITTVTNGDAFADTGLTGGETYWYRIIAYNWVGESLPGNPVSVTITAPKPPSSLTASIGTTNRVNLWWNSANPHDQDGFIIERAADSGSVAGPWTEIGLVLATNAYSGFFTDINAMANTTNWYRVRAFNLLGTSSPSVAIRVRIIPPLAVGWFNASAFADRVNLQWSGGNYGSEEVSGYKLEHALDANGVPGTWELIASKDPDSNYHTDTGRAAGAKYWYRVRAFNWIGESPDSVPVSVTIVGPPKPSGLSGLVGSTNQVNLHCYAAYPRAQDGFIVESAPDLDGAAGTWTPIATLYATNASSAFYADTNAAANTTNWYRVRAFNVVGTSPPSDAIKVSITPPPAPAMSASSSANRVNLWWADYFYHYGEIGGYKIERAADVGGLPEAWELIATITSNLTYYTDTVPASAATYWYRVRAYNWVGESSNGVPASVTITGPAAPTWVQAGLGSSHRVDVFWYAGQPNDQDGFVLERFVIGGDTEAWSVIATIYATNYSYGAFTDTNVVANTTNVYRVRAFNALGISPYSALGGALLIPPNAPLALSAILRGTSQVDLNWQSDGWQVEGYKLERALDVSGVPETWTHIANVPGQYSTSFYDATVATNYNYWYRVRAYNWIGDSPAGTAVLVHLPGAAVPKPRILAVSANGSSVLITWQAACGTTNVVEACAEPSGNFSPISPGIAVSEGSNGTVSYWDLGALTNSSTRFYRIHVLR